MEIEKKFQKEQIGQPEYVNKNCWLAKTLGYPPSKRCQYCESNFRNCLFSNYLIISLVLILFLITLSFLVEGKISNLLVISIFILIIVYGYFFNKSTEKIIEANFAQRKAKEALEKLTEKLESQVEKRTEELKKANGELKNLDKSKNQFLLATQHHLRTPLTSIMGYVDLLLGGSYGEQNKKTREIIGKLRMLTDDLIKIVNEFLDITQFQLGKEVVILKPGVQLEPILEEMIGQLKLEADSKGIYLKFNKPKNICTVKADPVKLKVALYNIIDNAVKYTLNGGVVINIIKDDVVKIIVKDTGIGIASENTKSLFGKTFERGETARKTFVTGRGIGLYISGEIIKAHNGKIWAESEGEDKGSTFFIELPLEK